MLSNIVILQSMLTCTCIDDLFFDGVSVGKPLLVLKMLPSHDMQKIKG